LSWYLISSIGQGAMFAAADDFSHLIDDDIASSPGDMIGSGAVSRRDNAGNLYCLCCYSHFAAFSLSEQYLVSSSLQ